MDNFNPDYLLSTPFEQLKPLEKEKRLRLKRKRLAEQLRILELQKRAFRISLVVAVLSMLSLLQLLIRLVCEMLSRHHVL